MPSDPTKNELSLISTRVDGRLMLGISGLSWKMKPSTDSRPSEKTTFLS